MSLSRQHFFWGSLSPLGGLAGIGLLIMASARLSWAITVAGSLFWVFGLTSLTYSFLVSAIGGKCFPVKGRSAVYTCLAAFFGSAYLIMFWLLSPFAAFEVFMLLLLVPLFAHAYFVSSESFNQSNAVNEKLDEDIFEQVSDSVSHAASLVLLLIAFAIVREPLSYSSLTFPGTAHGMITLINFGTNDFFPIRIFASSAGALLLLGYIICLYQYGRNRVFPGEQK